MLNTGLRACQLWYQDTPEPRIEIASQRWGSLAVEEVEMTMLDLRPFEIQQGVSKRHALDEIRRRWAFSGGN